MTSTDALTKFFKNMVGAWAPRTATEPFANILHHKLVRDMAVWFATSAAPFDALHSFYVSGDETSAVTFLMFLSVATTTGGLGSRDMACDVAEDLDHELGLWMTRVRDSTPTKGATTEADLRMLLGKACVRLADDADAGKDIQKGLALVVITAIRVMFITTECSSFSNSIRALRQFAAGPSPPPPKVSLEVADAYARAMGAEQLADAAEKKAAAAEKRAVTADKKAIRLERRMGDMAATLTTMAETAAAAEARVARLEARSPDAEVAKLEARVEVRMAARMEARLEVLMEAHMTPATPVTQETPETPETPTAQLDIRVARLEARVAPADSVMARLQAEMGWLLPQFRLQFCQQWNGVMEMWNMQHRHLKNAYVPLPQFFPEQC